MDKIKYSDDATVNALFMDNDYYESHEKEYTERQQILAEANRLDMGHRKFTNCILR